MALLSKGQILAASDLKTEDVSVPEWGGDVRLRTLTGAERDAFEASTIEMRGKRQTMNLRNLRARLVALCAVHENGARIFTDADIAALGGKSSLCLDRLFEKCQEMNGLSDDDVEKLTEVFDGDQSGRSISD